MVQLRPFQATHYNPQQIAELAQVITPPYDIISPQQQEHYYQLHPHNFIRIDFGKKLAEDGPGSDVYQRAAQSLHAWLAEGILVQDPAPGLYIYRQQFHFQEHRVSRLGFFALCELVPFADQRVLPHEKTLDAPKADRRQLLAATQANLSPVFALYHDLRQELQQELEAMTTQPPMIGYQDAEGIAHALWSCTEVDFIEQLQSWFHGRQLFIADGHHRYETALNYRDQQKQAGTLTPAMNYGLMYLTGLEDPNLLVLPTHRLLTPACPVPAAAELLERLSGFFEVQPLPPGAPIEELLAAHSDQTAIGMVIEGTSYLLLKAKGLPPELLGSHTFAYSQLDVAVLQDLILEHLIGFSRHWIKDATYIRYSPYLDEIQHWLEQTPGSVAFVLNPTPIQALCEIAQAQDTMPPKSTYFYPKVPSGLVLYQF